MRSVLLCLALVTAGFCQTRGHSVTIRRISQPGWLGVGLGELTPERGKALKLNTDQGMEIFHVDDNSPASKAGLKAGDVILELDGEKVQDRDQAIHAIADTAPGSK